jgi:tetratricopeptide (TPR) repeat protein/O-antigen ligase
VIEKQVVTRRYLFQEVVLFLGVSFLFLFSGSNSNFGNFQLLLISALLLTIIGLAWVLVGLKGSTPLALPLAVWVTLYLISLPFSIDVRRSIDQMILMAGGIFLFALSADLAKRGWQIELIIKAVLFGGIFQLAILYLNLSGWYASWLSKLPGDWLPFIAYRPSMANVVAMMMNLLIMLALSRFIYHRSRSRIFLAVFLVVCFFMLLLTSSRAGWIGTACGLLCMAVLWGIQKRFNIHRFWHHIRSHPWLSVLLIVLASALMAGVILLLIRQANHPTHAPLLQSRDEFWGPAWKAFLSSPLLGTGAFTYANAYLSANSVPLRNLFIHAHGSLLNLLAERGILGVLSLGWLFAALVWKLWLQVRNRQFGSLGELAGVCAALTAFSVHSLFDCFHTEPAGMWGVFIVLGAVLGRDPSVEPPSTLHVAWFRRPWGALVLIASAWISIWMIHPLYKGSDLANQGKWSEAVVQFAQAVKRDPFSVIANQQLGLAQSVLAQKNDEALDNAISALETTIALQPSWAMNYLNLGGIHFTQGNYSKAEAMFQKALDNASGCWLCALNLGMAAEKVGNTDTARQAYLQALDLFPDWADASYWQETALRIEVNSEWMVKHPIGIAPSLQDLESRLTTQNQSQRAYTELAEGYIHVGRFSEAEKLLNIAGFAYSEVPWDRLDMQWTSVELAAARGEYAKAISLGQQALDGYAMQGVRGPGSFGVLTYASVMFRRPAMAVEIAPQVINIAMTKKWKTRADQLIIWTGKIP